MKPSGRWFRVAVGFLVAIAALGAAVPAGADAPTAHRDSAAQTERADAVRSLAQTASNSALATVFAGKKVEVHVSSADGATDTWSVRFDQSGTPTLDPSGFQTHALNVRLSGTTLDSIVASGASATAFEKAVTYGLVEVEGADTGTDVVASMGMELASIAGRAGVMSAEFDFDDDGRRDAVLDVEGIDDDGSPGFDAVARTVIRDANGDGALDSITSERRDVGTSVAGGADVDGNRDGTQETLLRVLGRDLDSDGRLDERQTTRFVDSDGDGDFDVYAESVRTVEPTTQVRGEWDVNGDGATSVRIGVEGHDADGDDRFDRKTTTVALNLDGEPGFESTSRTTASVTPVLSVSAEFDVDDDGRNDTEASLSARDGNGDGELDEREVSVLNDTDGDGEYDSVQRRDSYDRGFFTNGGGSVAFLDDPGSLTLVGVIVSIASMLLQLAQGE